MYTSKSKRYYILKYNYRCYSRKYSSDTVHVTYVHKQFQTLYHVTYIQVYIVTRSVEFVWFSEYRGNSSWRRLIFFEFYIYNHWTDTIPVTTKRLLFEIFENALPDKHECPENI